MANISILINKHKKSSILFLSLILSLLLFRGRLGSDDLEVFNLVYGFNQFDGSLASYLNELKSQNIDLYNDIQKPSYYTFYHRFTWVLQTSILFFVSKYILLIFNIENYFVIQYISGFIITLQTILSFFIFLSILVNKGLDKKLALFCSFLIFFGTGIICLFSGQYIESTAILLILLYINFKSNSIRFLFSFLLFFIKPFYILIILSLKIYKISNKNFFINITNFKILNEIVILIILCLFTFFVILDAGDINNYFFSQNPTISKIDYFRNLYNIFFSFGAGIVFTLTVPIILILKGANKITLLKILIIIFICLLLSFWEGFHGGVQGIRYILPFLFIFIDEYVESINKIYKLKKKLLIIFLFVFTSLNLPSLEYRNFIISEYENNTIENFNPKGPAILIDEEVNKYEYYKWPIENIKFNNLFFSSYVIYCKIFNKNEVKIKNLIVPTKNIFPQTGLARLIYIKQNNINIAQKKILKFIDKNLFLILTSYYLLIILFWGIFINNLKKVLNFYEKN